MESPNNEVERIIQKIKNNRIMAWVIVIGIIIIAIATFKKSICTLFDNKDKTTTSSVKSNTENTGKRKVVQIFDSDAAQRKKAILDIERSLEYLEKRNIEIITNPVRYETLDIRTMFDKQPKVVIADTVKGKGVASLEGDELCHIRTLQVTLAPNAKLTTLDIGQKITN